MREISILKQLSSLLLLGLLRLGGLATKPKQPNTWTFNSPETPKSLYELRGAYCEISS